MDFTTAPWSAKVGRALFRHRSWAAIGLLPAVGFWFEVELDALIWLLGVSMILAGAALRLWSIGYLGRSARTRKDKAKALVTGGPFALSRNPIYLANIIATSGFVVLCETLWYLPVWLVISCSFYSLVIRYEEFLLSQKFPAEYTTYCERTPRWIPNRLHRLSLGCNWGLGEVLHRERSFLHLLVMGFLVIAAKELVSSYLF